MHGTKLLEGRQEGRQEGILEEKLATARELLVNGAELAFVEKITKLPLEQLKELEQETKNSR